MEDYDAKTVMDLLSGDESVEDIMEEMKNDKIKISLKKITDKHMEEERASFECEVVFSAKNKKKKYKRTVIVELTKNDGKWLIRDIYNSGDPIFFE